MKQGAEPSTDKVIDDAKIASCTDDSSRNGSFSPKLSDKPLKAADGFEPINIEGQSETGIWIHHPGSEVAQVWEPRKGKSRNLDCHLITGDVVGGSKSSGQNNEISSDESTDSNKSRSKHRVRKGLKKLGSVFRRSPRDVDKNDSPTPTATPRDPLPSPRDNIRALDAKNGGIKVIIDEKDTIDSLSSKTLKDDEKEENAIESPRQGHMRGTAKRIFEKAGKSARDLRSVISRKASRKYKTELGVLPTDKDSSLESISSDDDSLSPTTVENPGLVVPGSVFSIPESVPGNSSFKSKDDTTQTADPSGNDSFNATVNIVSTGAGSGNSSFKSKDGTTQTPNISGNDSFNATVNTVSTGAGSGNSSFKSTHDAVQTPKSVVSSVVQEDL